MMNLSVNIQTVALDLTEAECFQEFILSEFDCEVHAHPTLDDELIIKGAKANVRDMLVWHYQSLKDANELHPEAFEF